MAFTLDELVSRFGGTVIGNPDCQVTGLAPLDQAAAQQLSFLANPKYLSQVETTGAAAVLIAQAEFEKISNRAGRSFLITPNPYAYFARVAQLFVALAEPAPVAGIHPSAVIDPSAQVATSASVGPHVVIEAGAVIDAGVRLAANVYIGHGVRLGKDVRLYPNVTIYQGCELGERVIIHSGAVIGADGFGFAPDFNREGGEWVKIPQVGRVRIGADVEIGANTTIDRGAMADTVVEQGVKIDNQVQIAHNCRIGAYTVIAGCTGIAGSTTIGRHCVIGGAVGIGGHLTLADGITVAGKSSVTKSLTRPGVYASTFPAIPSADWNRNAALMRNLDKMRDRLKQLETALNSKA
jgi:UDP-3-O-[3-hydroxymyristoyl] glucosamine N-acyltransferase